MEPKTFYIAGVQFRTEEERKALANCQEGNILDLVPEPDNNFDTNAVKIMKDGFHFGYVPRRFSSEVAAAIECEIKLTCAIITLDPTAKTYEMCEVEIMEEF